MKEKTKVKEFPKTTEEFEYKLEECIVTPIVYKYRKSDGKLVDRQALNPLSFFMANADRFATLMSDAFEEWKEKWAG